MLTADHTDQFIELNTGVVHETIDLSAVLFHLHHRSSDSLLIRDIKVQRAHFALYRAIKLFSPGIYRSLSCGSRIDDRTILRKDLCNRLSYPTAPAGYNTDSVSKHFIRPH